MDTILDTILANKEQTGIYEDITETGMQQAFDDVDSLTLEQLRAQLIAARQALALKTKCQAKAKELVETMSPEELLARQEAIESAQAEVDRCSTALADAKAQLAVLQPRSLSVARRGPTGVGVFIKGLINEGLTNTQILARVALEWPDNNTNANCVNGYRSALKKWPNGKRPTKHDAAAKDASTKL